MRDGEIAITTLSPEQAEAAMGELVELLIDAVSSGASIGFMPPLQEPEAMEYWHGVVAAIRAGSRVLLVANEDGRIEGSVQLALETRANGNHRRRGLARRLMKEAEAAARRLGRTLLVMDTRKGGEAEKLCESLGYTRYGEVPAYARSGDGNLRTTVFFYRQLQV